MTLFSFTHKGHLYMGEVAKVINDEGLAIFHARLDEFPEHVGISDIMPDAVDTIRGYLDELLAQRLAVKPIVREEENTDV